MLHSWLTRRALGTLAALLLVLLGWHLHWSPPLTFGQSGGCRRVLVNALATPGAPGEARPDLVISGTAVMVVRENESRCSLLLSNTGNAAVRCADSRDGTPTATAGLLIAPGGGIPFEREGSRAWRCIRATLVDSTMNTGEALP